MDFGAIFCNNKTNKIVDIKQVAKLKLQKLVYKNVLTIEII